MMVRFLNRMQDILDRLKGLDFLAPLAFRLYLAPIFLGAGFHKAYNFNDIVAWFEFSLRLPYPDLMAFLATSTEILGGFALLFGFAVRWLAMPLMITMLVALSTAHWENGWFAIAPSNPDTNMAAILAPLGFPGAQESLDNSLEVGKRLDKARTLLKEHGNYDWLTEKGAFVVLNNGIEFAMTYFIMLLSLFFTGAGRYLSIDYWIRLRFRSKSVCR